MMNRFIHTGLAVALTFGVMGAAGAQSTATPPAGEAAAALDSVDRQFLNDAAHASALEIRASRLALRKGQHLEVKGFAQKMIDDHAKLGERLTALARAKGYEAPNEPSLMQKAELKTLEMRGDGFDKAYAKEIGVSAHEDAVELFEKATQDAHDPQIKQFAIQTLPTLKQHLENGRNLLRDVSAADL